MKNPFKGANEDVNDNIENGTNEEIRKDKKYEKIRNTKRGNC